MPRVRPEDFKILENPYYPDDPCKVWARWWRHRDGTVTHVHYDGRTGEVIGAFRRDRFCTVFKEPHA